MEGAVASIMVEAMAKEVKTHLCCSRHTVFSSKKLVDMIVRVSKQHIKCVSSSQVDLEHMVTGTVLTPDTVSIHFTHYNPSLDICSLSGLQLRFHLPNVSASVSA